MQTDVCVQLCLGLIFAGKLSADSHIVFLSKSSLIWYVVCRGDPKRKDSCSIPLESPCTASGALQTTVKPINPVTWGVYPATNGSFFLANNAAAYNETRAVSIRISNSSQHLKSEFPAYKLIE